MIKKLILLTSITILSNCSTYVEETINAEFIPLKPSLAEMKLSNPK